MVQTLQIYSFAAINVWFLQVKVDILKTVRISREVTHYQEDYSKIEQKTHYRIQACGKQRSKPQACDA